ncbi:unnamed protein product [Parnassius apollo]|uniref:(apollo) hypothetical protein n=1 Tax=Parnassius apollo TaxID=110799 RepID=A0A8S3Y5X9_PARAO|nr:unnamed protein product [Parnassius apollo]CAG5055706.1 unnamed protein product [Parnassius apollo]
MLLPQRCPLPRAATPPARRTAPPYLLRCVHCTDTASVGGDAATAKMPPSTRCDTACTPHRTTPTCCGAYTVLTLHLLVVMLLPQRCPLPRAATPPARRTAPPRLAAVRTLY